MQRSILINVGGDDDRLNVLKTRPRVFKGSLLEKMMLALV